MWSARVASPSTALSLTVADLVPGGFRIWLIPHTLEVRQSSPAARRETA
jgi:riboflavin synthase alpha subunit